MKSYLDPPSSDEASDDGIEENKNLPTVSKVGKRILDMESFFLSDTPVPTEHSPCIFLAPISSEYKSNKVLQALQETHNIEITDIQIIFFNPVYPKAALLWLKDLEVANQAYHKLKEQDLVELCGESKLLKWVDYKALYPGFNFYAVILRGLNKRMSKPDLRKFMTVTFRSCEIREVNKSLCGVFMMNSIVDVCIVCGKCNEAKDQWGNVIKAHIHPETQKRYSEDLIGTLMSDLPKIGESSRKANIDILKVLDLGMKKASQSGLNPLENLITNKKNKK